MSVLVKVGERLARIYTQLEIDHKINAYDDLPPVPLLIAKVGANTPTLTTFNGNIKQYTFDASNDEVHGATEILHGYKEGSDINVHVHWATNGLDTSDRGVKWEIEYTISNGYKTFPSPILVSGDITIDANTSDRTHFISGIGTIPGNGLKIGAYILWRFRRIASSKTAPTSDPFALAVGFHVLKDSNGSRQLFIK